MAYVLGVICADGCLTQHANGYHGLNVTSKDLSWLQSIKATLQAEQKIGQKRRACQLQIRNQTLYASLIRLNLTPRKSKTLQLPNVYPVWRWIGENMAGKTLEELSFVCRESGESSSGIRP